MNMTKFFLITVLILFTSNTVSAQDNILNATRVIDITKKTNDELSLENDKPLDYGYVNKRDILWSKIVWEFIDINQKINLPYFFPIIPINNRRSLFDNLINGIKSGKIKDIYDDSYFKTKLTSEQIEEKLSYVRTDVGDDGQKYYDTIRNQSFDNKGYMIKGMWYFDKRLGELKYRLLAIGPLGKDVKRKQDDSTESIDKPLFWVFYPSARQVLHNSKVFNPMNVSQPISYDHLLNARRFNAVIVREENIYGDRKISDYIKGNALFQLLEADRIKESIRNKEIDMWNY
jgi:gliding motility associated protien GldN